MFLTCTYSYVESANILTDKEALISLKSRIIVDSSNPLSSWNENSSSPCNWTGIACDSFGQRVVGISLSGFGLTGSISPDIGNLSFLGSLQLQNNQLTGVLPNQIGDLSRLKVLNVSSNYLHGMIPSNISRLSELQVIDLMQNNITGMIPEEISSLKRLRVLNLGRNSIYGEIPSSIANLSSLINLNLGTNRLTGIIPGVLGGLENLQELDVTINNLTGIVPSSIYNMSSLVHLALASNNFWGKIPYDVGMKLPNLLIFNFCFNKFTGTIPGSLHNLTNIKVIRMAHNLLEGTVPPGLGNLPFLQMYNIGFNKIVSPTDNNRLSFITSLTNSTHLNFLAIDGNHLEGEIPETIGNLSKVLSKLYMGGNRISGSIPKSISRLRSLTLLNMSYNLISGEIPPEIGNLTELQSLSLAGNQISGSIPNSLGKLQKLNNIDLSKNELAGVVPSDFGNFQNLLLLDLSNNRLNGSIAGRTLLNLPRLSAVLNLSKNLLSGSLPQEIGHLESVVTIDLSNNLLSGNIPDSIGNCKSLEKLFMADNILSGPIPDSIAKMRGLDTLDLSSNKLSGSIPNELQYLPGLRYLNLSFNNLDGVVPRDGVFKLPTVYLEGNSKLCLHLEACNARGGRHSRRMIIVYTVIAISATLAAGLAIGSLYYAKKSTKAKTKELAKELLKGQHQLVSYDELREGTGNFNQENLIGDGSFGSVYKGYLKSGTVVAIKVLHPETTGSLKSFFAECEALRNVRHRNLVRLITSCRSIDFKNTEFHALVYEFLSNGSFEDWVKGKRKFSNGDGLNIIGRLNVAIDVACALEYLHHDSELPVVHCDLKPSNILLDEDMTAKLGDFGLARILFDRATTNQTSISSTHVLKGSIGYIPPEYGQGVKPSIAGDVYSFGVMLMELFTGKSPTHESFNGGLDLTRFVQSAYPKDVMRILDPELIELLNNVLNDGQHLSIEKQHDCLITVIEVALACTKDYPDGRINMRDALCKLKTARCTLLKPTSNKDTKY